MQLLVLQPDGTVKTGDLDDWKQYAKEQEEQIVRLREIIDLQIELRLSRQRAA